MGVFDRQTATALRLIKKNGQLVTWNNYPENDTVGDTPWNGGSSTEPVQYKVYVAFFPTKSSIGQLMRMMRNSDVPTGNETGYMGRVNFKPSSKDTLVRADGAEYRIKNADPIDPNGEGVILYEIEFLE